MFAAIAGCRPPQPPAGTALVADATFIDPPIHRRAIEETPRAKQGVPFAGFWLEVPLAELERRIIARHR